jgi:signal peptidase I
MNSTVVALSVFGMAQIAQFALWVWLLRTGARWAKIERVTTGRALLAVALITVVELPAMFLVIANSLGSTELGLLLAIFLIVSGLLVPPLIIRAVFRSRLRQAILAWLPTWLLPVFAYLLVLLLIRPLLFEAFSASGNSMAPTILANHFSDICPVCGGPAYGSPRPRDAPPMDCLAVCDKFHVHTVTNASTLTGTALNGDKFMVAKYLRPRRWDVVAFRLPSDPQTNYVKRLVGLPGETVVIKDGAVWIDGRKLDPPPSLKGLNYVTEMPSMRDMPPIPILAGTSDRPAVLGQDEYFVLGDFSPQSLDSRLFKKGAPGHPAYAVPESYIIGVVTHIYWPPSRWRVLR